MEQCLVTACARGWPALLSSPHPSSWEAFPNSCIPTSFCEQLEAGLAQCGCWDSAALLWDSSGSPWETADSPAWQSEENSARNI